MDAEAGAFGRSHSVGRLLSPPSHRVQRREIVMRFAEAAVEGDSGLPLALRILELAVAEVRAAERKRHLGRWRERPRQRRALRAGRFDTPLELRNTRVVVHPAEGVAAF